VPCLHSAGVLARMPPLDRRIVLLVAIAPSFEIEPTKPFREQAQAAANGVGMVVRARLAVVNRVTAAPVRVAL